MRPDPDSAGFAHESSAESLEPATPASLDPAGERLAKLEQNCVELESRWLRAQADYQNARKRAQSDLESGIARSLQPLLGELCYVLDFLDMALACPAESAEAKDIAVGVQMTRARLVQALERSEVRPIEEGLRFDPRLHEAAATEAIADAPAGSIVRTLRRGYTWRGGVLRPAQVVVASAPRAAGAQVQAMDTPKDPASTEAIHE